MAFLSFSSADRLHGPSVSRRPGSVTGRVGAGRSWAGAGRVRRGGERLVALVGRRPIEALLVDVHARRGADLVADEPVVAALRAPRAAAEVAWPPARAEARTLRVRRRRPGGIADRHGRGEQGARRRRRWTHHLHAVWRRAVMVPCRRCARVLSKGAGGQVRRERATLVCGTTWSRC